VDRPKLEWKLERGFATEEDIERVRTIILDELQTALDGSKKSAVFIAFVRLSGELEDLP
jgi:hypothetical protein